MKTFITILGILILVGGGYLVYDGYQMKQTTTAQIENELSTAIKALSNNNIRTNTKINDESKLRLIGGGVMTVSGLVLIIIGLSRKAK